MRTSALLLSILIFSSCQDKQKESSDPDFLIIPTGGKLEKLLSLPRDSALAYYDLSNDFLMQQPDLSGYTIRSLDLSHNYLDSLKLNFLPQELEKLDFSYNYLEWFPFVGLKDSIRNLQDLNLSHNYLSGFVYNAFIFRLDLSHNYIANICLYGTYGEHLAYWVGRERVKKFLKRMRYLNISHNPELSNKVWFRPSQIDTIIHDNIANDDDLKMNTIIPPSDY